MQQLYNFFYRQYGIRRLQSLLSPRTFSFEQFPRNTIFHYYDHNNETIDVDVSKLYFQNYSKKIIIDFPDTLTDSKGKPIKKAVMINSLIRPFIIANNRKFRYLKNPERIKDEMSLVVFNYNYLDKLYRYIDTPLSDYYKWWNVQKTIWDNINNTSIESSKNHFVIVNLPTDLPSYSLLKIYSDRTNNTLVKIFDTADKLMLLEIWKWLNPDKRVDSIFANLTEDNIGKVNLLITTKDNKTSLINLGYLNSWIKGKENKTDINTVMQLDYQQIQKVFLKYLITLNSSNIEEDILDGEIENKEEKTDTEDIIEDTETESEKEDYFEEHENQNDHDILDEPIFDGYNVNNISKNKIKDSKEIIDGEELKTNDISTYLADIEDNLEVLENMNKKNLKDKGINLNSKGEELIVPEEEIIVTEEEIKQTVYENISPLTNLRKQADEYAEYNIITSSEYRKLLKDIDKFSELENPYNASEKLINNIDVTKEDIAINDQKNKIVASDLVADKTMLESSLISFDSDYINKVMKKDILAMVTSIQNSGVMIKKYEVEEDNSALGNYEYHRIEVKPINGSSSVIHFKIPKINGDGSFIANGNKYIMRKQRADVPIRKIDPNTIALTSYYGKTFVTRNQLRVNSTLASIIKTINLGITTDHPFIKNVAPAKVFDNNFKAPYIYSAISDNFKSFSIEDNYNFIFDYTERYVLFTKDIIDQLETNGKIVCGFTKNMNPIVVDTNNEFFIYEKNLFTPIGDILNILKMDTIKTPVDFSDIRIFSKTIPVGVILGYFIGFKNLLTLLKAKYRIVDGRKNKELQHDEYAITFKNKSFIFSRKDGYNSLILAGFTHFENIIKKHDYEIFNRKDIYLNLLESRGLTSIYIREIINTDKMFVDPITKNILEEMNEPVTFKGLLIRATELLLKYYHPDSQDMAYMRIRGYERIAGSIYKELSATVRQFTNKNISGKSKLDISPYQIWQSITKDPAIKLIEDINPIQNLKESETVTYVGEGGRTKESMNKASRAYHINDMGVVSEATVDSSDVGINAYLSANPNFKDLRGLMKENKQYNPSNIVSTSALLSPGMTHDDGKRVELN